MSEVECICVCVSEEGSEGVREGVSEVECVCVCVSEKVSEGRSE